MDEAAKQLLEGVHEPIPMAPGAPGQGGLPLRAPGGAGDLHVLRPAAGAGGGSAAATAARGVDWAEEVRRLLDEDYPEARKVTLVCDNLNTHPIASLYEAFPAAEAHRLARRLEIDPHAAERQLAERGGDRAVGAGAAVPGPADRLGGRAGPRVRAWERDRNELGRGLLEVHDGGRPGQAEASLPTNLELMV